MPNKRLKPFGKTHSQTLKISICDKNPDIAKTLADTFQAIPEVEVIHGDLFKVKADALLSPANSFGDMSGGIDQAIDGLYKGKAQPAVRDAIIRESLGELPVGQALVIEMGTKKFPYLICAPTMRIPGRLPVDSINSYLAMRAALVTIKLSDHPIRSLAMSCLCTGVGGMGYEEAALQLLTAYVNIEQEDWKRITHPIQAPFGRYRT